MVPSPKLLAIYRRVINYTDYRSKFYYGRALTFTDAFHILPAGDTVPNVVLQAGTIISFEITLGTEIERCIVQKKSLDSRYKIRPKERNIEKEPFFSLFLLMPSFNQATVKGKERAADSDK